MTGGESSIDGSRFWEFICRYSALLYLLLLVVTVLLTMNVLAMVIDEQPQEAFLISVMNFVLLGTTAAGISIVLWYCNRD